MTSTSTATQPLHLSGLVPVLVPPREVFDHGLTSPSRVRFGRFFTMEGSYVITKPLGTLIVGATGNWVRRWELEVWFSPCPNLRC